MGQHYIPQKYLRGFTDPSCPGALWQFDKRTLSYSEERLPVARIAQARSFYERQTERQLNESVERPANEILDTLRSGRLTLNDDERLQLSIYIATALRRVPHFRAKWEAAAPRVLAELSSDLQEQIRAYERDGKLSSEKAGSHLAELDAAERKFSMDMPEAVREQIRSPFPNQSLIALVYRMHWRFVRAARDEYFVTTDNPVFFFECYGLGTEYSEFTFPVSRELAIMGSLTPVAGTNNTYRGAQFVREANRRLISAAFRFIYSGTRADWVKKVAAKRRPYLSRIKW